MDMTILKQNFQETFSTQPTRFFLTPGRTEIGGNHTDHQNGKVLAGAVNLTAKAAVRPNGEPWIRLQSKGWELCQVDLKSLEPREEERGTTAALIRGVAGELAAVGCPVSGFDAWVDSQVLPGSGLSSSAAFEVLLGTIMNALFYENRLTPPQLAQIGQRAENRYFGKPCGLMDQMACAVGGLVYMDFYNPRNPEIRRLDFDFTRCGHALCILDTGADHAGLTNHYASIPGEMSAIAQFFGETVLSRVSREAFFAALPQLRATCGDRAVLRAIHFFQEQDRVDAQVRALEGGDFPEFLRLVNESGNSSWQLLQNISVPGSDQHQELAVALTLCRQLLRGRGACRVHGGGFAGTVQAFVPLDLLEGFYRHMEEVLGEGSCHILSVSSLGGQEFH